MRRKEWIGDDFTIFSRGLIIFMVAIKSLIMHELKS